jgi:hypothetical protein
MLCGALPSALAVEPAARVRVTPPQSRHRARQGAAPDATTTTLHQRIDWGRTGEVTTAKSPVSDSLFDASDGGVWRHRDVLRLNGRPLGEASLTNLHATQLANGPPRLLVTAHHGAQPAVLRLDLESLLAPAEAMGWIDRGG